MFVDLHMHTFYSDGIFSPHTVVEKCKTQRLKLISITDHDTVVGLSELPDDDEIKVIPGVEITCQKSNFGVKEQQPAALHILGYGLNLNCKTLTDVLLSCQRQREKAIEDLLFALKDFSLHFEKKDIPIQHGKLMQMSDIKAFLHPYLDAQVLEELLQKCAEKQNQVNLTPKEAIELIHRAGGLAVWAHPFVVYGQSVDSVWGEKQVEAVATALKTMGLDGLESTYLAFSKQQEQFLKNLALKLHLLSTAGSDFHGYEGRDAFLRYDKNYINDFFERLSQK